MKFVDRYVVAAACAGLLVLSASSARADLEWLAVRVEGGGSYVLSEHQREVLGYEAGFQVIGGPAITIIDPITIQARVGNYWFPSDDGFGSLLLAGGGLRIEPMLGDVGRLYIDGDAYYTRTGDLDRIGIDVGVGFEFAAAPVFSIGPYVRYLHVLAADSNDGGDAMILVFGISMSLHGEVSRAAADADEDGVLDPDDMCPTTPQGDTPDPERRGCPLEDADGDGVSDGQDLCPSESMGANPDPERRGCPLPDSDGDGVSDRDDVCPSEAMGDNPDPSRRGCPMPDSDGDGVFDPDDQCPTTSAGEFPDPNRQGCPDGDDDNDTVRNSVDQCPTQHQGFHPDPARAGCPAPDQDNDTVPDDTDACPTRPGAPSQNPRRNGCPGLVRVDIDRVTISQQVFFANNADRILPRSNRVLNALADALISTPEIRRISIEGHTDDVGTDEFNLDLSTRRAQNVMNWLVANGVEASRLEAVGHGESRPLEPGTSRRTRARNRRVEFRVIDPAPPAPDAAATSDGVTP